MPRPEHDPANESMAMRFARLTDEERKTVLDAMKPEEMEALVWDWDFWSRPKQQEPPGDWRTWLVLAGRGFGKTRMGAEWTRRKIERGIYRRINVVGATAADTRDIIVEGPSGILSVCPPSMGAIYSPTKRRISFDNGAAVVCFSAEEPERLRGHQCEGAWADELASWEYEETWTQLMLGLRLGSNPRVVVTTTPKPTRIIKRLYRAASTHLTTGSTYENWDNLAETFLSEIIAEYEGRRIGRQELYAEILGDSPGALWKRDDIDEQRISRAQLPDLKRVVVAVDPAVSYDAEEGDETGIMVVGAGADDQGYVLEDASGRYKPDEWGKRAIALYYKWEADRIVGEINQGGDMVENTFRVLDPNIPFAEVRATRGKFLRAEPIAALYERKRIHHVGFFDQLEEQMTTWEQNADWSPDRLDALVWGLTFLFVSGKPALSFPEIAVDPEMFSRNGWRPEDRQADRSESPWLGG